MAKNIPSAAWLELCSWENLLLAFSNAARGKHQNPDVARFEYQLADHLLDLQNDLLLFRWKPGGYHSFYIKEPKRRLICAAAFADRIVHHALCNIIEPRFEPLFSSSSFANRKGMGTHRAIDRFQLLARRYRYVLRVDIVKHFPSIDHQILMGILSREVEEVEIKCLTKQIIDSGCGLLDDEYTMVHFPGDDLLAICRPRGLPIGNLTSQFWSNCYLHPFDQFIERELGVRGYVRYVDDMAFFSDSKNELWSWKQKLVKRLARLRLTIHDNSAQVMPVNAGVPWLGFVVYPGFRRIKSRKVRQATRQLRSMYFDCIQDRSTWPRMSAKVKAWVSHASYADGESVRKTVLSRIIKNQNGVA